MSEKIYDKQGRWRNKTVAFRMSSEEAKQLNIAVALSGLNKQDYIISKLQNRDVIVRGNPRVYKALRNQMIDIFNELKRIDAGENIGNDLHEIIELISKTMDGLKDENLEKC